MNTPNPYIDPQKPHVIRWVEWLQYIVPEWETAICLTGMRPSWQLHLGHYVGALENWLKIQNMSRIKCQFLLADYHVMWDQDDMEKIRRNIYEVTKDWLAVWLDPEKSDFILQSALPEWAELMMFFMNLLPIGELERNPTLKAEMRQLVKKWDEAAEGISDEDYNARRWTISAWFYNYPVSQAADILLPKWTIVPVGDDQIPHIELTREIVRLFNNRYGTTFEPPYALISKVSRLSGIDGQAKMSKSLWNAIMLADDADVVARKVKKMYTDTNRLRATDPGNVEWNVVFMHLDAFHSDWTHLEELKNRYRNGQIGDGELKKLATEILNAFLDPIRHKRATYDRQDDYLRSILQKWTRNARLIAESTMKEVREKIGIIQL